MRVWTALGVGVLGAIALIVLAVVGVTRARTYAAQSGESGAGWRSRKRGPEVPPAPTYRDEAGLVWHDLTAPREEPDRPL
jgi:hypothetical protein